MAERQRVLIIKHGFSETCDHNISPVVSYGDVFRCTCLLEAYRGYHVTWISARAAHDLLTQNHLINSLILADNPEELPEGQIAGHYDILINLEKQKDWCEFAESISATHRFGFKNWAASGNDCYYPESVAGLSECLNRGDYRPMQESLFKTVGLEWSGERYVLGYQPKLVDIYDIGLNCHVGPKWPTKLWPQSHWQELYRRLSERYAVCWQQSLNSVRHYIDWLASCRLIVTCDSLGLHMSLALRKKIVALFGSTPPEMVYMYGCGVKLTPGCDRACVPCFQAQCEFNETCMEFLTVDTVVEAVEELMHSPMVPEPLDMPADNKPSVSSKL